MVILPELVSQNVSRFSIVFFCFCFSGIETLTDYRFKYGRNPLLELPLAINPTGCARSESRHKMWKKAHTQRTTSLFRHSVSSLVPTSPSDQIGVCPYSKQFVHSKSSQYKKMKQEWRNNVYLARYVHSVILTLFILKQLLI